MKNWFKKLFSSLFEVTFAQALLEIRPLIANGDCFYICEALNLKGFGCYQPLVMAEIAPYETYARWRRADDPVGYSKLTPTDLREGRLLWIDYLIQRENSK